MEFSEYLTADETASILKVSKHTVYRIFAEVRGVIDLGKPESRFKRRYRVLRIPKDTVQQYIATRKVA